MESASSSQLLRKSFKSALCIIPPDNCWPRIQNIRVLHDKHYKRWMPHVNVLYPFTHDPLIPELQSVLNNVKPFKLTFKSLDYFAHSINNATVWLKPETNGALENLEAVLVDAFPTFNDLVLRGGELGYEPHLSLGQFNGEKKAFEAIKKFTPLFANDPIEFKVDRLCLISRKDFHDPFAIDAEILFGSEDIADND
ncbi:2348_t:CDS:2 [Paraglomus occultum]|uniref:2348_t:CDS:1 n=1 Tax=Paraglomus occultum TaxID=144539 RepID=A0A9N8WDL5_9GLOM|nr:2348_t:CDS:2 [Paraglomus occultum]